MRWRIRRHCGTLTANLDVGLKVPLTYYRDGKSSTVEGHNRRAPRLARGCLTRLYGSGAAVVGAEGAGSDPGDRPGRFGGSGISRRSSPSDANPGGRIRTRVHTLSEFECGRRATSICSNGLPLIIQDARRPHRLRASRRRALANPTLATRQPSVGRIVWLWGSGLACSASA